MNAKYFDYQNYIDAVIRVGSDFQVELPNFKNESSPTVLNEPDRGVALWYPIDESLYDELFNFLKLATDEHG